MRQMTSDFDTQLGTAQSNLRETDRKTHTIESQYDTARAAFLEAARNLQSHGGRFTMRKDQLEALGGSAAGINPPKPVELVTIGEVEEFVP